MCNIGGIPTTKISTEQRLKRKLETRDELVDDINTVNSDIAELRAKLELEQSNMTPVTPVEQEN